MKKRIAFFIALMLILGLFTGCGGNTDNSSPETSPTPDAEATMSPEVVTNPDYYFAADDYEVDDKGWPTDYYEYKSPFCNTDEVLTYWTVNFTPQYLPEEGLDGIDYCIEEQKQTGVDIEYLCLAYETRLENFTALLASDDLPDIMNQADLFYPGTEIDSIENNYLVNIYDYKEYCPNYMYFIKSHMEEDKNLYDMCFIDDTHISKFLAVDNAPGLVVSTVAVRSDWLDDLGVKLDDITVIEEFEELARLMKSEKGASYPIGTLSDV